MKELGFECCEFYDADTMEENLYNMGFCIVETLPECAKYNGMLYDFEIWVGVSGTKYAII